MALKSFLEKLENKDMIEFTNKILLNKEKKEELFRDVKDSNELSYIKRNLTRDYNKKLGKNISNLAHVIEENECARTNHVFSFKQLELRKKINKKKHIDIKDG